MNDQTLFDVIKDILDKVLESENFEVTIEAKNVDSEDTGITALAGTKRSDHGVVITITPYN